MFWSGLVIVVSLVVLAKGHETTRTCLAYGTCTDSTIDTVRSNVTAYLPAHDGGACADQNENCDYWADEGECQANPDFMHKFCLKSCKACGDQEPEETSHRRNQATKILHRSSSSSELGVVQDIAVGYEKQTEQVLKDMVDYMDGIRQNPDSPPDLVKVLDICENKHPDCAFWAVLGECDKNPGYMKTECAPVCRSCDQLSITTRCPLDPNTPNTWQPGSLHDMFVNMTTLPAFQKYEPVVLSKPDYQEGDSADNANYQIGPWVVVLENFVSEAEALRLIELGAQEGYKRSADVGKLKPDGSYEQSVNNGRTSTNAWCQHSCYTDPTARIVMDRISNLTNTPEVNSEYLQLLRYDVGQFYQRHHDYIGHQRDRQPGPRIMTVYVYLNDVEEGGGTNFPLLDLTVTPKRGRALVWPSVLNDNPDLRDPRTDHQALPVKRGVKLGANAWIHLRDFKGPNQRGCQ